VKKRLLTFGVLLSLTLGSIYPPRLSCLELDWAVSKRLNLEVSPLDIATSADGKSIFILAAGEVLVYSVSEDKVVRRIPVDKAFDMLAHSGENTLILGSRSNKVLKMIQLEIIHEFTLSGLPIRGPEHAPVTIAVFGDYQ